MKIEDIEALAITSVSDETSSAAVPSRPTKSVKSNKAIMHALMVNTPVAEVDDWKDADVFIENNECDGDAMMFNHPVPGNIMVRLAEIQSQSRGQSK